MSAVSPEPRDDRRAFLLKEAARLFHEKGYERTSVRDLGKAVGLQSGSLFHYFASKEDILAAVMAETIKGMIERMREAAAGAGDTADKLYRLIRTELESLHGADRHGVAVAFFQWHSLSEGRQRDILALREDYEAIWLAALRQASEEDLIETDPFITRRLLTGAVGWTVYWYDPEGEMGLEELAGEVVRMVGGWGHCVDG